MNKILTIFIVVVIIILVMAGLNIIPYFDFYAPNDITEFTDLFDYSAEPITEWNDSSHEFKFNQKITSFDNEDFKDINIDLLFYNHGKLIGTKSNKINQTEHGDFDLDFIIKLDSQPDAFYYNVTDVNWA